MQKLNSIKTKLSLVVALMLLLMTAVQLWVSSSKLETTLTQNVLDRQAVSLRILIDELSDNYPDFNATFAADGTLEKVTWAQMPTFTDNTFIDTYGRLSGQVGTLFAWDDAQQDFIRVTTTVVKDDGTRAVGTGLGKDNPVLAAMLRKEIFSGPAQVLGKPFLTIYVPILSPSADQPIGVLVVASEVSSIEAALQSQLDRTIPITLASLAVALALLVLCLALMLRPLKTMVADFDVMTKGDYSQPISAARRKDELGALAQKAEVFRLELDRKQGLEQEAAEKQRQMDVERAQALEVVDQLKLGLGKLAQGDLSFRVTQNFAPQYEVLRESFNATVDVLAALILKISETTALIQNRSSELQSASDNLSQRTETQAATLEETVAALVNIGHLVKESAKDTSEVANAVNTTRKEAEDSGAIVVKAVEAMIEIERSSAQINHIISLIEDIAFQTNLLSLNAGVEAARAGQAGRGFAIVASEVGALSRRSSDAAKEITRLVVESSQRVETGVTLVNSAGAALSTIVTSVTTIADLMGGIASRASDQSMALSEVNTSVSHLDRVTQENAAMAEEVNAAVDYLRAQSLELAQGVALFSTEKGQAAQNEQYWSNMPKRAHG
jgi:methyl-accepting chemotaxis protein